MKKLHLFALLFAGTATVAALLLLENIAERKAEARNPFFRVVELDESSTDPAEWGKNFPRQYDSYRRTVDMEHTRFGGSEADPFAIGEHGVPKTVSKIDQDPRLKTMWAGYAFAIDFREERGHAYMLHDQRETERVLQRSQPGACLHCHSSTTVAYREAGLQQGAPGKLTDPLLSDAGLEQLRRGFAVVCAEPYAEAARRVAHPVTCLDCHDPGSAQLRITRPGFLDGIAAFAASDDPAAHMPSVERWRKGDRKTPYDPNVLATRQEMRSFTCGQCHVEYYFRGEGKLLTFPWHKGLKAEQMLAYYDDEQRHGPGGFSDWKHKITGAGVVKVQHPEFELWSQGIHARSGVSCADCHMPYVREGALKVSDHHVRSPLLNIARACQTCHKQTETELRARVDIIQDRTKQLMDRALDALVGLVADLEQAQQNGISDAALAEARRQQRQAQYRLDYVNAENSMGFHAPQEAARILGEAIDHAQQGRLALAQAGLGR